MISGEVSGEIIRIVKGRRTVWDVNLEGNEKGMEDFDEKGELLKSFGSLCLFKRVKTFWNRPTIFPVSDCAVAVWLWLEINLDG